jgi:hypothetical protein
MSGAMAAIVVSSSAASWLLWEAGLAAAAAIGGVVVLRGLWLEGYKEKEGFSDVSEFRTHKAREGSGRKWVFWGVAIEVFIAIFMTFKDGWDFRQLEKEIALNDPRNQPIVSVSAIAQFIVKGDKHTWPEIRDNSWLGGLIFCEGCSSSNKVFYLDAKKDDATVMTILGGNYDREYTLSFHKSLPSSVFGEMPGMGKPAKCFDDVHSFVMQIPQISTNEDVQILSGTIDVTVNSDLKWHFEIPPQKQKYDVISGQMATNANGEVKMKVLPVTLVEPIGSNPKTYFFDGK